MKENSVGTQVIYFFSVLAGLTGLGFAWINFSEVIQARNSVPLDFFVLLSGHKALIYCAICGTVYSVLLLLLCYSYIRRRRKLTLISSFAIVGFAFVADYIYNYLTGFAAGNI